jgi:hypothetical protein
MIQVKIITKEHSRNSGPDQSWSVSIVSSSKVVRHLDWKPTEAKAGGQHEHVAPGVASPQAVSVDLAWNIVN